MPSEQSKSYEGFRDVLGKNNPHNAKAFKDVYKPYYIMQNTPSGAFIALLGVLYNQRQKYRKRKIKAVCEVWPCATA